MNFKIEIYHECNLSEVQTLFREVFFKNKDINTINLEKKLNTIYTGSTNLAVLVRSEHGELAGVLGIYPVIMKYGEETIKAGQIGDAMIREAYRGQGLFTLLIQEIIKLAKAEQIELIYTLPSIHNKGSYKGFVKSGFIEKDSMFLYSKKHKSSIIPRVLRKINYKLYEQFCSFKTRAFSNYLPASNISKELHIPRTKEYIEYKKFNSNQFYQLKSGIAWLNISKFEIKLGDFEVNNSSNFNAFIEELFKLCSSIGKDYIYLMHNNNFEKTISNFNPNLFKKNDSIKLMVYYINMNLKGMDFSLNFSDSDTF